MTPNQAHEVLSLAVQADGTPLLDSEGSAELLSWLEDRADFLATEEGEAEVETLSRRLRYDHDYLVDTAGRRPDKRLDAAAVRGLALILDSRTPLCTG